MFIVAKFFEELYDQRLLNCNGKGGKRYFEKSHIGIPVPLSPNTFESVSLRHIRRDCMGMIA